MRIFIFVLLIAVSQPLLAERMYDGFYISGGYSYLNSKVIIFEEEVKLNRWVPKVSMGYGKTSRHIGKTKYRMFLGIETSYIGSNERSSFIDVDSFVNNDMETRESGIEQGETLNIGLRIGITENKNNYGGNLYVSGGYSTTDIKGEFSIKDRNDQVILAIKEDKVNLGGGYFGIGYEYAFTNDMALRIDFHKHKYDDEQLSLVRGSSNRETVLIDPEGISLKSSNIFIGLTGRF